MARNRDPFTDVKLTELMGLDQRLFSEAAGPPGKARQASTVATQSERKKERSTGRPSVLSAGRSEERPNVENKVPPSERRVVPRASMPAAKRRTVHRPYDFFEDQVRWLNRKKLELDERYGRRIPTTAMVQLAVDMLIADFEAHGEASQLIGNLVKGEPMSEWTKGRSDESPESHRPEAEADE